ncbi:MAG TPA: CoA transferase [Mycobacteriales bacterium]|nr:CoA transferase [Mycobacteriales bacterium]
MQPGLPLDGVVVVEMATFVAGPSSGLALWQLGAEVVRVDPLGGAVDYQRWPLADTGRSVYWASLNRGKRSLAVDVRGERGRDLVRRLICEPGEERGIFVTNAVGQDWLSWESLSADRADLIHVHVGGQRDGRAAVDYTVNAEVGLPLITGPLGHDGPVNHVLPAWDLLTGMSVATAVLAALRRRDRTGVGAQVDIALADVALAGVANLGWLSEAAAGVERERQGNELYGSYGHDFATADGRHVMVVALTPSQWTALVRVTGVEDAMASLETEHGVDLRGDESARYRLRAEITAALAPWFAARPVASVAAALTEARVLWAPYQSLTEAAAAMAGPLHRIDQPGIGDVVSAESPLRWAGAPPRVSPAPALGADSLDVLTRLGGLTPEEVAGLVEAGVVHDPSRDAAR